jgi:hypothetical protein
MKNNYSKDRPRYLLCANNGCTSKLINYDKLLPLPERESPSSSSIIPIHEGWSVKDVFDFDNVAFSQPLADHPDGLRYLCCAECDAGPIGYAILDSTTTMIAIDKSRVIQDQG